MCEKVGIEAGLVDICTFGVINLFLSSNLGTAGDWLVVHMRPEYTSIAILRREDMMFFRNRAEGDAEALEDVVHQTAMYYQDRLEGRGFSRILLGGIGRLQGEVDLARRNLESRMGTVVEPIDPTRGAALTDRIQATPELMATLVAAGRHAAENSTRGGRLMLRTNLSTRPFYNIRAVQLALGALALLVAVLTVVNLVQLVRLTASERALGARAQHAETEAQRFRDEARRIRSQIDAKELNEVAAAAQEANAIIDLRAFSWSDLFAQLEATLPESVRLTSFQPSGRSARAGWSMHLGVQARRVQDLESFLDALEKTGRFHEVLAAEEETDQEGLISAVVEGVYVLQPQEAAPQASASAPRTGGAAGE